MKIIIDFDGTCLTHQFPEAGKDIGVIPILQKLLDNGHDLILFTMRSKLQMFRDDNGKDTNALEVAINWFKENKLQLSGINETRTQKSWTDSPKPYGDIYIDDRALGCPLMIDKNLSEHPFINWKAIENILLVRGYIKLDYENGTMPIKLTS